MGLFEVKSINDPCILTIATNLKEYIEHFKSDQKNKRHKGVKKNEQSMNLKSLANRVVSFREIEDGCKIKDKTIEQSRFTVRKNEMVLETVEKKKFSQLNDKRYYFACGILSLPFSHPYLTKINEFKFAKKQKIEQWFLKEKETLKKLERNLSKKSQVINAPIHL